MGQTISFLSPLGSSANTRLGHLFSSIKVLCLITLTAFLITSCSSQQPKKTNSTTPTKEVNTQADNAVTSADKLALAKKSLSEGNSEQAIIELISASELLFTEGATTPNHYKKSLWLADKSLTLINANTQLHNETTVNQRYQLKLIKAKSLLALDEQSIDLVQQQLIEIETYAKGHNLALTLDYYQTQRTIWQSKNRPIELVQTELFIFSLQESSTPEDSEVNVNALWRKFSALTPWQVKLLQEKNAPYIKGWLALTNTANQWGSNSEELEDALATWQRRFAVHPANSIVQQLISTNLSATPIVNIAVLLPLSGSQQLAGLTAQQGILAAYQSDSNKHLHFFDTNTLDWNSLNQQFSDLTIDFVIGPLLRNNLAQYLALELSPSMSTEESDNNISNNFADNENSLTPTQSSIPTLLLNVPANLPLKAQHYALSMRPEDEGKQAAASLSYANYKQPIVLSHDDAVSKRIAQAFAQQWQLMTDSTIDVVYFDTGKKMQTDIKSSLDVHESEARIKEFESHLKYSIKTQTRNRRDVDMIYLIGSSKESRLVKPYIEVNISPFAPSIPVYASSRSHSIQYDNSSSTDLQGLTFTEIPWLLDSTKQNKSLAKLSKELWPNRSDSLSRIFALGYDSYNLLDTLPLMPKVPYIRHYGQTGILQLHENGILNRSLLWGEYKRGKVSEVEIN
ncbi:penicillin-binding protein activator [Colwellia asteriadis]|uniref:Penicillin-binding protein activator n=1 Tax=Colwellia asteriadis TaxID=517723 RepID=A0ABN1L5B2_9GAMM